MSCQYHDDSNFFHGNCQVKNVDQHLDKDSDDDVSSCSDKEDYILNTTT